MSTPLRRQKSISLVAAGGLPLLPDSSLKATRLPWFNLSIITTNGWAKWNDAGVAGSGDTDRPLRDPRGKDSKRRLFRSEMFAITGAISRGRGNFKNPNAL